MEEYKDVGTRLLQIAQRRSDEGRCEGNIKLVSMPESINWYIDRMGFKRVSPPEENSYMIQVNNSNLLYLPDENKERLSSLRGGL